MSFPTEDQLRDSFVRHYQPSYWSNSSDGRVLTTTESTCSEGRADWVWAGVKCDWPDGVPQAWSELMQRPSCSRIISTLESDSPKAEEFLSVRLGVGRPTFRRAIRSLLDAEIIEQDDSGDFSLCSSFRFPKIEIRSFEFKLDNWRRAFQQALRYRSFSHRVYVVMPADRAHRPMSKADQFRTFNVGLISHDDDGNSRILIASECRPPRSTMNFVQAIGLLTEVNVRTRRVIA